MIPENVCIKNNTAQDNPDFVRSEMEWLLKQGLVSVGDKNLHVVNPLTVAYGSVCVVMLMLRKLAVECSEIRPAVSLLS